MACVIETCWPTIEVFVDLEGASSVCQTCRALHRAIVDGVDRKLRVSHFEVDNFPASALSAVHPPVDALVHNWRTAPARVPLFLSRALNAIHFPSLRRLRLDFPPARRRLASGGRGADVVDDAACSGFPIFAANLAYARNLEYLHLNAGRLMADERSGRLEASYEIFADNLGRCTRLRELKVENVGYARGNIEPLYSVALLQALTSALRGASGLGLTCLRMALEGSPSDPLYHRLLRSRGVDAERDFFEAALSLRNLVALELCISSSPHWNALLRAVTCPVSSGGMASTASRLSHLRGLRLCYDRPEDVPSAAPALEFFSGCHNLITIVLELCPGCWEGDDVVRAMDKLLGDKPSLESLMISFCSFADRSGKLIGAISNYLRLSTSLRMLNISRLMEVDEASMSELHASLASAGMMPECSIIGPNAEGRRSDIDIIRCEKNRLPSNKSE